LIGDARFFQNCPELPNPIDQVGQRRAIKNKPTNRDLSSFKNIIVAGNGEFEWVRPVARRNPARQLDEWRI
jgi:hypothetical protein